MKRTLLLTAMLFCSPLVATGYAQIKVERPPPPATIEELAQKMDLVVQVRIDDVRDIQKDVNPGKPSNPYIEFDAEIVEVGKNDGRGIAFPGSHISVLALGQLDLHERGFRPFKQGKEVLLYLKWNDALSAYQFGQRPDGAFLVSGGKLIPFGKSPVAQQHAQKAASAVLSQVRAKR